MAKKTVATNIDYSVPPSSYTVQTADNVLRHYGVSLNKKEIQAQLQNPNSFYRKLLQVPALFIYNDYLINQCYNMEYYCADQVMNMVFATSTAKAQHKEGKSPISKERGDRIYKLQTKSNDNVHALDSLMEQHNRALQDYNSLANSKVKQWHELVSDHVQQIIAKLQEMGFSLSENFKATLQKNLNKQGSDREISAEDVSEYEIKKQLSSIENAIVSSLIAEVKHESH